MTDWPEWMDEFPMEFWTDSEVAQYIMFAHALWKKRRAQQEFKNQIGERSRS